MAMIKKEAFGKLSDGRAVELYTLRNTKGTEAKITTYGARLVSWRVMGPQAKFVEVVLGYVDASAYVKDDTIMGGIVGRHANRSAGGKVVLNGKEYQLDRNTGSKMQNHIHGGFKGFHDQLWTAEEVYEGVNHQQLLGRL